MLAGTFHDVFEDRMITWWPKPQGLRNPVVFDGFVCEVSGVPDRAARQKTRSTGCNYAGWEILALDHLLAGIFVQRLAG